MKSWECCNPCAVHCSAELRRGEESSAGLTQAQPIFTEKPGLLLCSFRRTATQERPLTAQHRPLVLQWMEWTIIPLSLSSLSLFHSLSPLCLLSLSLSTLVTKKKKNSNHIKIITFHFCVNDPSLTSQIA